MGLLPQPTAHTDALVLRAWPCGESSCIASLLTRQEGFVKVLAKAVRKPGSRLRPLVEPGRLVTVEFSLDPARELQFLRGGSVNLDPMTMDPTLEKSAFLLGAMELIDRCRPLGQAAGHRGAVGLFEVCEDYIRVLSSGSCRGPALLFFAFEWELLEQHGLAPEIDCCINCGSDLAERIGAPLWFSPAEGGAVCEGCARDGFAGKRPLGLAALGLLRDLSGSGLEIDTSEAMPGILRREIGAALHYFMGYHLPGYRLPTALDLLRSGRKKNPSPVEVEADQPGHLAMGSEGDITP